MTTLGDLIKKYRKLNNLSMEEFSKRTNLSKSYISILERNKHPRNGNPVTPTLETIKQVASAMQADVNSVLEQIGESDIKVNHVDSNSRPLTPKEKQILEPYNQLNNDGQDKVIDYAYDLLDNTKYLEEETITYIGLAAAGNGYHYLDNIEVEETIEKKNRPRYDFVIKVTGDSMTPKISDEALAFVRIDTDYDNGKIYVIDNDGAVYIKRVYFENDKLILKSINQSYKDIVLTFGDVRILGEVVDWSNKDE